MIIKVDTPNQKYAKKNDLPSCVYIYIHICVYHYNVVVLFLLLACILHKTRNVLRKWCNTTCVQVSHLFDRMYTGTNRYVRNTIGNSCNRDTCMFHPKLKPWIWSVGNPRRQTPWKKNRIVMD